MSSVKMQEQGKILREGGVGKYGGKTKFVPSNVLFKRRDLHRYNNYYVCVCIESTSYSCNTEYVIIKKKSIVTLVLSTLYLSHVFGEVTQDGSLYNGI
jgi:hypothetical protein